MSKAAKLSASASTSSELYLVKTIYYEPNGENSPDLYE